MIRKTLKAAIAAELIDKVFRAEGWIKVQGQERVKMVKTLYDLSVDHRAGRYVATPK